MNKKIIASIAFVGLFGLAPLALAQLTGGSSYTDFSQLITQGILPVVTKVIASLSTVMIIVAGIMYLTSGGNPGRVESAKKALIYAIIGIAIALAASAIAAAVQAIAGA
jgi:hypothetical protein